MIDIIVAVIVVLGLLAFTVLVYFADRECRRIDKRMDELRKEIYGYSGKSPAQLGAYKDRSSGPRYREYGDLS